MSTSLDAVLQAARLEANLTQLQLARLIGVHVNAIARWENGRGRPRKGLRPAVIQAFGAVRPELGRSVAAALAREFPPKGRYGWIPAETPPDEDEGEEPAYPPKVWVDSGIFRMADRLDVSPRLAREGAVQFLRLLRQGDLGVEAALAELEAVLGPDPEDAEEA